MEEIIEAFRELCVSNSCPTCKYKGSRDQWECAFRYAYERGTDEGYKKAKEQNNENT